MRFGSGGVGGRGRGPRDGAIVLLFLKRRKMAFLKGALWGGGVPTGAGLVDGGVDQGP